ncbi:GNAT family N-acetyltransferase [Coralloluteibacterium thermophilus]|uniref:GNAT family N-acetyltransferase n=1 Tax=Coralloluteibacterium thermophilum TaxID=2707049 RepID=A0ABV9NIR8_9GAMM
MGRQDDAALSVREVPADEAPMALLMLADPSEEKIRAYLPGSRCFVGSSDGSDVAACVVLPRDAGTYELMSISVRPDRQQRGHGTALLKWVLAFFGRLGARRMEVGTGTFGHQLAFYQRQGFRVARIDRDFFVDNYPEPIFEDGIRHLDMLRLVREYA